MTLVDLVVLAVVALAAWRGWRRGGTSLVLTLAGAVVGVIVGAAVAGWWDGSSTPLLVACVLVAGLVGLGLGRRGADALATRAGGRVARPVLVDRGDYRTYVPRWNARFGADRMLYLPFGRIARDPLGLLRQVETFLGLPAHDYRDTGRKVFASDNSLVVPDKARAALRAKLEPQFAFLEETFGRAFTSQFR